MASYCRGREQCSGLLRECYCRGETQYSTVVLGYCRRVGLGTIRVEHHSCSRVTLLYGVRVKFLIGGRTQCSRVRVL